MIRPYILILWLFATNLSLAGGASSEFDPVVNYCKFQEISALDTELKLRNEQLSKNIQFDLINSYQNALNKGLALELMVSFRERFGKILPNNTFSKNDSSLKVLLNQFNNIIDKYQKKLKHSLAKLKNSNDIDLKAAKIKAVHENFRSLLQPLTQKIRDLNLAQLIIKLRTVVDKHEFEVLKKNLEYVSKKLNEDFKNKKTVIQKMSNPNYKALIDPSVTKNFSKQVLKKTFTPSFFRSNSVQKDSIEAAKSLHACYFEGYEFPLWALNLIEKNSTIYSQCAKTATVYYDEGANLEDVKQMVLQREPVNISMERSYKQLKFKENFGWRTGYYGDCFEAKNTLAPNIAIYCKTPYQVNGDIFDAASPKFIHVINSVGFAFDDFSQPDYKYFFGKDKTLSDAKKQELIQNMVAVFAKIFQCGIEKRMQTIVLSGIGCVSFAKLYPGSSQAFIRGIFLPSLNLALESFADSLTKAKIKKIHIMGDGNINKILKQDNFIKTLGFDYKSVGFIPEIFESVYQDSLDKTLFVNAWDPWSIVGNGNAKDRSLDGSFGRLTAMAVLCWPKTNSWLNKEKYVAVEKVPVNTTAPANSPRIVENSRNDKTGPSFFSRGTEQRGLTQPGTQNSSETKSSPRRPPGSGRFTGDFF